MLKKSKIQTNLIHYVEKQYTKKDIPKVSVGDTIKIKQVIQEGNKERTQISEGVVIAQKNTGTNKTITIRKIIQNIGIERIYLINSPKILNIEIVKQAKVKKSKLYYLRNRSGKATRLKKKLT
uniref:Large ribosomal subunit protein bL19c n=1 Tax=Polysiphonia sp. TaxID=1967842 RepID=A0A1Z1MUP6_9FLOR|nr:ribosomal protein L19 [Polysiphonia sp.]